MISVPVLIGVVCISVVVVCDSINVGAVADGLGLYSSVNNGSDGDVPESLLVVFSFGVLLNKPNKEYLFFGFSGVLK